MMPLGISVGVFFLLVGLWFLGYRIESKTKWVALRRCRHQIKVACEREDPKAVNAALLTWGSQAFRQPIHHLEMLQVFGDLNVCEAQFQLLNTLCYRGEKQTGWGKPLWKSLKASLKPPPS